jgi:hypothetical protein
MECEKLARHRTLLRTTARFRQRTATKGQPPQCNVRNTVVDTATREHAYRYVDRTPERFYILLFFSRASACLHLAGVDNACV